MSRRVLAASGLLIVLLAANWVAAVARFQVNGLYWDQWNFFDPLFNDQGWLAMFTQQHGPHRQGIAFVFTSWIMQLSNWDTRIEALWGAALLAGAAGLMLRWKYRLSGRLGWEDLWLPVAALALRQYETIIVVPNASHAVFPLVLLLVAAGLTARPLTTGRWIALGAVGLLALFTGFGIFVWVAAGWLTGLILVRLALNRQWKAMAAPAAAAAILGAALAWFLHGYEFNPASPGATFPYFPLWRYPVFVMRMFASRMDLEGKTLLGLAAGGIMAVLSVAAFAHASWRVVRDGRSTAPGWAGTVLLLGTGLGYAVFTALGRVHLGSAAGEAPRYTPLMVSCWLGLLAWSCSRPTRGWRFAAAALGWSMVIAPWADLRHRTLADWPGTLGMSSGTRNSIDFANSRKIEWLEAWDQTGSWQEAENRVPLGLHPEPDAVRLGAKVAFLEQHGLSFAAERERSHAWLPWWNPLGVTWVKAMGGEHQQWMADEAVLFIEGRPAAFLNLRLASKAPGMPDDAMVEIALGGNRAQLSYQELLNGISMPAPAERQKLALRSLNAPVALNPPQDDRLGSFLLDEPTLTASPNNPVWWWAEDGNGLWPDGEVRILDGFYGWEAGGAFGWTTERLRLATRSREAKFLNIEIGARFRGADEGPVDVSVNGRHTTLTWSRAGLRFAIELPAGEPMQVELANPAGARSPQELGQSADGRRLAFRLTRLSVDETPAFPLLVSSDE